MLIGSKNNDAFGIESGSGQTAAPLPADVARSQSATPLPSDVAMQGKKPKREKQEIDDAQISKLYVEEKRSRRRKVAVIAAVLVVVTVFSLFVDGGYAALFDPNEVFASYGLWFQDVFAGIFGGNAVDQASVLVDHPAYFRVLSRVNITAMTVLCGAVLALAGTLYQSSFRNPIASPSMLGVSSAIQLGIVILVLIFGSSAAEYLGFRYLICYICVVVVMVVLFGLSAFMTGKGRPLNIVNLLLMATILTQFIGVIVTYVTIYVFDSELWVVYNNVAEGISPDLDLMSWAILIVTCLVGIIPIYLLRFRVNGLNFADADMKMLGIDSNKLRIVALVCGTVLLMGAQVQMGTVAMICLVVPHISRMIFGAEFKKQFAGNVLLGAALLVLCRDIAGLIPVLGAFLPISTVLNFVVLPFFVWMLATQQRGWEQ